MKIDVRVWCDGKEIDLRPAFLAIFEKEIRRETKRTAKRIADAERSS